MKVTGCVDMKVDDYTLDEAGAPGYVATDHVITAVRVRRAAWLDELTIFNRGKNAGMLFVDHGDGKIIAERLLKEG